MRLTTTFSPFGVFKTLKFCRPIFPLVLPSVKCDRFTLDAFYLSQDAPLSYGPIPDRPSMARYWAVIMPHFKTTSLSSRRYDSDCFEASALLIGPLLLVGDS